MAPQVCCFCGARRQPDRPYFREAREEERARAAVYRAARFTAGLPVRAAAQGDAQHVCTNHTARKQQNPPAHTLIVPRTLCPHSAVGIHGDAAVTAAAVSLLMSMPTTVVAAQDAVASAAHIIDECKAPGGDVTMGDASATASVTPRAMDTTDSEPSSTVKQLCSTSPCPAAPVAAQTYAAAEGFTSAAVSTAARAAPSSPPSQVCSVSLREISPGPDNHCLFHAVAVGLGGRTHAEMRELLRRGVETLDSVHLLARYDLALQEGADSRIEQRSHESLADFARRQQRQLRQFQASYTKRTVFRDLSNGGTPELFLLSHALQGSAVFLVYNGVRPEEAPHVIASIHMLDPADQEAVRSGHNIYAGAGEQWPPARQRLPANAVQICLLHDSYRGISAEPNHWDLFYFHEPQGRFDPRAAWPNYESESNAHEQHRRDEMARLAAGVRVAHQEAHQLRHFAAERNLAANTKRSAMSVYKGKLLRLQPFPCGETEPADVADASSSTATIKAPVAASSAAASSATAAISMATTAPSMSDALECAFDIGMSLIAPGRLGVFATRSLPAGSQLPYPSIVMAERVHDLWLEETGGVTGAVQLDLPFKSWSPPAQQQYAAVGVCSRKAALLHNTTLAAEQAGAHLSPNCSLFHLHPEQVASLVRASSALGQRQPVLPDSLVYVQLTRDVRAGEELVLRIRDAMQSLDNHDESRKTRNVAAASALSFLSAARIAPRSFDPVALLPPIDCVPVEIVSLGIEQWMKTRQSQAETDKPLHRDALDDALADVQMELETHLTDGARLEIWEYKKKHRREERKSTAEYSSRVEGERRCKLLKVLLAAIADPTKRTSSV